MTTFDEEKICNGVPGAHIEVHSQIDSTNDRAIELIRQSNLNSPAVIIAESQTSGRGQRSRKWWSGTGSLTFSYVTSLEKNETENRSSPPSGLISLASALAVSDALKSINPTLNFEIKWPNDVMLNQSKIAGILVESVSTDRNQFSVIGIGANINNANMPTLHDMDDQRESSETTTATSLAQVSGRSNSLSDTLIAILIELEKQISIVNEAPLEIVDRFNQVLLWREQAVFVTSPSGATLAGICQGITPDGGLKIKTKNQIEIIHSGSLQKTDSMA
ncbi:MAG: biotin--[acetyl-CoA-carboxylase] ligase [Mariniblastus sp.]|nr:biotin--[acetyl-CoA-carboxylase] ligase [Mariniblastus sp.]MDG2183792.1 biotin--[acetyl-CoA-carboxylase] ligase [Mariniblastus sp.]